MEHHRAQRLDRATAEGALFTDQYQLTMAQLYFRLGIHERPAQFDHFFRRYPSYEGHKAGYCVNAGLDWLLGWMLGTRFRAADLEVLRSHTTSTGTRLFADDFLDWLAEGVRFDRLDLRAIPEGRVVHAMVPLTVVQGPLGVAQLLETSLLNHLNYQTLIASKAARIRESAPEGTIIEFGLRRAHWLGGNAGTRASLIGGADFSSSVGQSALMGFPAKGTHAHSMVQAFIALGESELDAFRAFAELYPDDCILLVDTIDTLQSGLPNAIRVFEELRRKGHTPVAVRLDSGDLAYLSIQSAKMLEAAGFEDVGIVLSNNLDELVIWQIITQIRKEAPRYGVDPDRLVGRLIYGVGTRLVTSWGEPALGGVYKLVGIEKDGAWEPALKVSESIEKILNPGEKNVWRVYDDRGFATADVLGLADEELSPADEHVIYHPTDASRSRTLTSDNVSEVEPLLVPVLENGKRVRGEPSIEVMRANRMKDVERLDPGVRRLLNPHHYHVSLTARLSSLKQELVERARSGVTGAEGLGT